MNFSPKSEKEIADAMPQHGMQYDFEVIDAEDKVSAKGNDMIALKLTMYLPNGDEYTVRDWLVGSDALPCVAKIQAFCKTTGILEAYGSGTLTAEMCRGLAGRLKLSITDDPQYGKSYKVADYIGGPAASQPPAEGVPPAKTRAANKAAENRALERTVAAAKVDGFPDEEIPF